MIGQPRFIGRESEISALLQALAVTPAVVLVEGEAGIGESRLVQEFLASWDRRQRMLVAYCPPLQTPCTLGPVIEVLRQAAPDGVSGLGLSALAGTLRPLFPEWATDLPTAPDPLDDATTARHRVFSALAELVAGPHADALVVRTRTGLMRPRWSSCCSWPRAGRSM